MVPSTQTMETAKHMILGAMARVTYKDWTWEMRQETQGFLLRWSFTAPDRSTGILTTQHGRWWYVSAHAVENEVIQTALAAALMAEEHEAREAFRVDGHAIYGPHFDATAMVQIYGKQILQYRIPGPDERSRADFVVSPRS